jgi:hypothetical protein
MENQKYIKKYYGVIDKYVSPIEKFKKSKMSLKYLENTFIG